jgi:aspartate dehydrogenase
MGKLKVGLIGCGTIGTEIAKAIRGRLSGSFELSAICDADRKKAEDLNKYVDGAARVLDLKDIVSAVDFVIEAASAKVSGAVVRDCVGQRKGCMIMSVGGVLGNEALLAEARREKVALIIPSGAISGIDALKGAATGKIGSVTITTTKPPKGLAGAPYLTEKGLDLSGIRERTVVFEGSAEEAVRGFPQNVNVSAVLSLAGIGAKKTRVRIIADPSGSANIHEIEITGDCGKISTRTENVPSEANPKTSALAISSAIAALEQFASSVRIGT